MERWRGIWSAAVSPSFSAAKEEANAATLAQGLGELALAASVEEASNR
jgi:hypothetical protein